MWPVTIWERLGQGVVFLTYTIALICRPPRETEKKFAECSRDMRYLAI